MVRVYRLIIVCFLVIFVLGCSQMDTQSLDGLLLPTGRVFVAYTPPGYAPPKDVFENNAGLLTVTPDVFTLLQPTSSAAFTAQARFTSLRTPPEQVVWPFNLVYRYGYVYEPTQACLADSSGCNALGPNKCCKGFRAFEWGGQKVSLAATNGTFVLALDQNSQWIDYQTEPKSFTIPRDNLRDGLNLVLAYTCKLRQGENAWKCGCSSATDTSSCNKWHVQFFSVTKAMAGTCSDGVRNQDEVGVDCGGVCDTQNRKCPGTACISGTECSTQICRDSTCTKPLGDTCTQNSQCASDFCQNNICASPVTCSDGQKNQDETGIDCGGTVCVLQGKPCPPGQLNCKANADCASGNCAGAAQGVSGSCQAATCNDAVQNQEEAGVDCGGPCLNCQGGSCQNNNECASNVCTGGVCQPPATNRPNLVVKEVVYGILDSAAKKLPVTIKIQNIGPVEAQNVQVDYAIRNLAGGCDILKNTGSQNIVQLNAFNQNFPTAGIQSFTVDVNVDVNLEPVLLETNAIADGPNTKSETNESDNRLVVQSSVIPLNPPAPGTEPPPARC